MDGIGDTLSENMEWYSTKDGEQKEENHGSASYSNANYIERPSCGQTSIYNKIKQDMRTGNNSSIQVYTDQSNSQPQDISILAKKATSSHKMGPMLPPDTPNKNLRRWSLQLSERNRFHNQIYGNKNESQPFTSPLHSNFGFDETPTRNSDALHKPTKIWCSSPSGDISRASGKENFMSNIPAYNNRDFGLKKRNRTGITSGITENNSSVFNTPQPKHTEKDSLENSSFTAPNLHSNSALNSALGSDYTPFKESSAHTLASSTSMDLVPKSSSSLQELLCQCSSPSSNISEYGHEDFDGKEILPSDSHPNCDDEMMFEDEPSLETIQTAGDTGRGLPPPPSIIFNTPFAHFLDRSYFERLNLSSSYVIPNQSTEALVRYGNSDYMSLEFREIELLGRGSFADAVKVSRKKDAKVFALKRTRTPFNGYRDRLRQLEEVEVLLNVGKNDYCIELIQAWEQVGHLYILTNYCDMGTLDAFMGRFVESNIQEELVRKIFCDVSSGVKHIHHLDIVHLDLKPSNIFLSNQPGGFICKIADFGLAMRNERQTTYEREGDRRYMAPEILQAMYHKPADIFSLGLILLEISANCELPESGSSWLRLRNDDLSLVPWEEGTNIELKSLISSLIKSNWNERPDIDEISLYNYRFSTA